MEKTVFASRCVAALLAFPFEGKVSAEPTDEVEFKSVRSAHTFIIHYSLAGAACQWNVCGFAARMRCK